MSERDRWTARVLPRTLGLRGVKSTREVGPDADVPFDDLVYLLAEGVATAQSKLDLTLAETVQAFADTTVEVVPRLTRTLDADGSVTTTTADPVERSLLELGLTPTRYQFSEATVGMEFDLRLTEEESEERTAEGVGLRAGTSDLREYRKYDRDVTATARLSATLAPTPLPPLLGVSEERRGAENGSADANDTDTDDAG